MQNPPPPLKLTGTPPTSAITRLAEVLSEFGHLGKTTVVLVGEGTNPYEIIRICRNEGRKGRHLLVFVCQEALPNPTKLLEAGVHQIFQWKQDKASARTWLKQFQPFSEPPVIEFEEAWALAEPKYDAQGQLVDHVLVDATPAFQKLFRLSLPCPFFEHFKEAREALFEPMQSLLQQGIPLQQQLPLPDEGGSCPVSMGRLSSKIFINAQTDFADAPQNFAYRNRFETFTAYSPLGAFEISPEGQVLFANAMLMNMIQVHSLSQASLWPQRIHPADRKRVFWQIRRAQLRKQGFNLPCRFLLPGNKLAWFQVKGAPFLNTRGELISFVGTVRDSNDDTIEQKTYRVDEVFNALPVPIAVKSLEKGELLFSNHAFQDLVKFSKATTYPDASCKTVQAYLRDHTNVLDEMYQARFLDNSQHELTLPGDQHRSILGSRKIIHYAGQEALLYSCVDITEAEANKQQLYSIIQALPDMLVRLSEDGTVLECLNPTNERRMFHIQEGDRFGKALPPHVSVEFVTALLSWDETKKLEVFEYHLEEENSPPIDVEVRVSPLGKGQFLALIRDITQSKRFQSELINARESAVLASRAKSQFLANMSHEIRTPINGVLGMIDLALSTPLSKEQSDYLYTAKTSGQNLLSIIADILDLSKIEADRLEIESIPMSLENILMETVTSLAHRAREKHLELISEMVPGTPEKIVSDPTRLRQILTNLIANSIKFTHKGEVFVQASALQEGNQKMLSISVSDTGVGIPKTMLPTIFDAFIQADGSITRRYGGTGLGLTITKQLVEKLGGSISVSSETDVGTCFRVNLPLCPSQQAEPDFKLFAGKSGLLLEANTTTRWVLKRMLEQWGVDIHMANSSAEAISFFQNAENERAFDLAIVDEVNAHHAFLQWLEKNRPTFPLVLLIRHPQLRKTTLSFRKKFSILRPISRHSMEVTLRQIFGMPDKVLPSTKAHKPLTVEHLSAIHILVAEDNPINAKLARALLEKQGHKVTVVSNGLEALQATEKEDFDVVVMDVQMPEMDGIAATQAIRSREKKKGTYLPIIALTANAMKGDNEICLKAGMDEYLTKPLQKRALDEALRTVILLKKPLINF